MTWNKFIQVDKCSIVSLTGAPGGPTGPVCPVNPKLPCNKEHNLSYFVYVIHPHIVSW
jgi:hypothetical protein